jgi:Nucleoside-diphosphate-sugar pyrophosphorylase involved in lipopolysaccharide biosynthesis/translation initiation factor 2B, gamma/epsilon subunits (eIF-2Bgamma/eIF-2Bepsilon)
MSTKIEYFFSDLSGFPIEDFFDGITEAYEILMKIKPVLDAMLKERDVREFHGEKRGEGPTFYGEYFVGEGSVIYNDVTIIGPVYIGRNCEILPGAIIRPYTVMCDGSSVGHGSEVKRGVLLPGAKVASLAFVGDSVLGRSARIGSGVITANRKFNQTNATARNDKGEKIDLGDSFFGLILGDSSRLGANSVTQPGTHIGAHTWVYPLTNVRGFIPSQKRVHHGLDVVLEENEIIELKP